MSRIGEFVETADGNAVVDALYVTRGMRIVCSPLNPLVCCMTSSTAGPIG